MQKIGSEACLDKNVVKSAIDRNSRKARWFRRAVAAVALAGGVSLAVQEPKEAGPVATIEMLIGSTVSEAYSGRKRKASERLVHSYEFQQHIAASERPGLRAVPDVPDAPPNIGGKAVGLYRGPLRFADTFLQGGAGLVGEAAASHRPIDAANFAGAVLAVSFVSVGLATGLGHERDWDDLIAAWGYRLDVADSQ